MIRQKQKFLHRPEIGQWGDCHRTAIACLLDIPLEAFPHFIGEYERRERLKAMGDVVEPYSWLKEQERFLNAIGFTMMTIDWNGDTPLDSLLTYMESMNPGRYFILCGMSPRGTNHSVVCNGGKFDWDPHPDGGFLIGPMDNGVWETNFLLPISMKDVPK